ncbi:MAG: HD domain-containing protein [Oscillospiraceae bacterium]|nr:HD domain-containing protein [Oscillospiraceae bacterium]
MIQIFYITAFVMSLICSGIYVYMWHKHFDVNFTLIFTFVPVACLGYVMYSRSTDLREAIVSMKVTYLGSSFLQLFILFSIFNLCRTEIKKWVRLVLFGISGATYLTVLTIGRNDIFYKDVAFDMVDGSCSLIKTYGPMHTLLHAEIIAYFAMGLIVLAWSWIRKKQVPRTLAALLVIPDVICVAGFFLGKILLPRADIIPAGYVIAQIVYLMIAYRVNLYDVGDTAIDSMVKEQGLGYISCDFKCRYLGSNDTAKELIPELADKAVDDMIGYKPSERRLRHFLDDFMRNEKNSGFVYSLYSDDEFPQEVKIFNVTVGYLYDGNRKRGYFITFTDDTANRKYMQLLDNYNDSLKSEVEEKTQHIVEMHDNLIMSLAMMVESRDNSTGGHIKRTSDGVKILVDEIVREGKLPLTAEFCKDVIKAAPMHDLGKIAVDDDVLRKPGRFTPEEYEKMKQHAAEGARVIHEILRSTDDESFKVVAENVAHYHHERWDGSGYPCGLAGEDIPIEARIMAIADVYDALVSKRVYKEAFDLKKADSIILEGMGTQFDPSLKSAYENARPRLEAYYTALQA